LLETLSRAIALQVSEQIPKDQFNQIDMLHYEIENKLLRFIKSLERKREQGSWKDRISDVMDNSNPESR